MKRKNKMDGISIQSFVKNYLGTEHDCSKLKHQGLKSFDNPYLIGVSNDFALKNFDYVVRNELIVVIDDFGNAGTYINPNIIKKITELETCKEKQRIISSISCHNFEEASFLFKISSKLSADISCLESLYGKSYELFYLLNKNKIIKTIRKLAKEEARRTIIFTNISDELKEETEMTEYVFFKNDSIEEEKNIFDIQDKLDDYQVTEKVNRQKKLDCRRIG